MTASVGPTWKVGGVSSSEGHCTVGHIHSCSKIRFIGWQRPKEELQCLDPGCNRGVVTHLQCCLACYEGGQKTNSARFEVSKEASEEMEMVQDHELEPLLQLCQNRSVDTRPSHHDVSEQTLRSWSGNGTQPWWNRSLHS